MENQQTELSQVSIYDFLILALAYKPRLYPDIDKLYEENKIECILAYHESSYKQSPALKNHTTMNQVYIRKVSGLFAWTMKQTGSTDLIPSKDTQPLFNLIKKGYKYAWNYVTNKRNLVLDMFSHDYMTKIGHDKVKELDIIFQETCFLFLAHVHKKKVQTKGIMYPLLQKYIQEACRLGDAIEHTFSDIQIEKNRAEIDRLRKLFHIGNTKKTLNLENIYENIIITETEGLEGFVEYKAGEYRERVFKEGDISKFIGALSGWMKSMSLNETELVTLCDLSAKELDEIFYAWLYFKKGNNLPREAEIPFIVTLLFTKALAKEYKHTQHYYLETASEEQYQDLVRLQNEIENQKEELNKEAMRVSRLEVALKEEHSRYESELESLRAELKQTKQSLADAKENEKELIALRQYVHHESQNEEYATYDEDTLESTIDYLKQKRIVVLGGHVKWQQRLKERLPHITLLNPELKNTDLSFLNREGTHLFVNTATNSHSFMKRVFAQLNKSKASLHYLHANQNLDLTLVTMKEMIVNE